MNYNKIADHGKIARDAAWYVVACIMAIVFILPFFWMASAAFKSAEQCVAYPPQWIPRPFTLRCFQEAFSTFPFLQYVVNSIIVSAFSIAGTLISCSLVAYGFSRFKAPLQGFWFAILLSTMMIPSFVTLLPQYTLFIKLHWVNTYLPLIVPAFLATNAFSIFMLRQFFMGFPMELDEAAQIDGCTRFATLFKILLPNSKTVLFIVTLFTFVGTWNDYFGPMIFLNDRSKYTLAVGLIMFKSSYGTTLDLGPMMAVALVSVAPIIVLYLFAQKYFVQGIVTTGIKA